VAASAGTSRATQHISCLLLQALPLTDSLVLFSEVHCIGQAEDGLIWEQLLLMAPCPIIALSATIGNAEAFNDWLAATQKAAGNELVMVQHPHRYSDLRKFIYTPPAKHEAASYLPLPTQRSFAQLGLDEHTDFVFL